MNLDCVFDYMSSLYDSGGHCWTPLDTRIAHGNVHPIRNKDISSL